MKIQIKKLSPNATIPTNNHNGDAGWDLYAAEDVDIRGCSRALIKTNIAMAIPNGYFGRICDRSGNALKKGLHVFAGIIDETYRGDIGVVMFNSKGPPGSYEDDGWNDIEEHIKKGDKIAQIIFEKYYPAEFEEVEQLPESTRQEKGFGSSDITK